MWIGGFDWKAKTKSTNGRRNENTEIDALSNGFIGIFNSSKNSLLRISEKYCLKYSLST